MSELAKVEKGDLKRATAQALIVMAQTLKTFGRSVEAPMVDGWVMAFKCRGFPIDLIEPTCAWFCCHAEEIPTPGVFMDRGFELHHQRKEQARHEAHMRQIKEEDEAKVLALREKYPEIDPDYVRSLLSRTLALGSREDKS